MLLQIYNAHRSPTWNGNWSGVEAGSEERWKKTELEEMKNTVNPKSAHAKYVDPIKDREEGYFWIEYKDFL